MRSIMLMLSLSFIPACTFLYPDVGRYSARDRDAGVQCIADKCVVPDSGVGVWRSALFGVDCDATTCIVIKRASYGGLTDAGVR